MAPQGNQLTVTSAIAELRELRNRDWTDEKTGLLHRAVNFMLGQHGHYTPGNAIYDSLKKAKIVARATYVDTHAHSQLCFNGRTRARIIHFSQRPAHDNHYEIAELMRDHFAPSWSQVSTEEYDAWRQGLITIGHRGKFLALMKDDCPGKNLVKEIHPEILDFLEHTAALDRYLLH